VSAMTDRHMTGRFATNPTRFVVSHPEVQIVTDRITMQTFENAPRGRAHGIAPGHAFAEENNSPISSPDCDIKYPKDVMLRPPSIAKL